MPNDDEVHALSVERTIDAAPEAIFDAFIALYDSDRPDWVVDSSLDLRVGGRWSVAFQVPDGPAFREERTITALDRPHRLEYAVTAVYDGVPAFDTTVQVTIDGGRVRLAQQGFPERETRDVFAGAWPDVLAEVDRRVSGRPS
ncbi:SRPBCC domain-containing protein [Dactylosporangium cerinum]|uniref:SRPBCC domain-containing protein n=1 Tax=Dactylosporangium cerinum TaxID=1434730 RepID=A0ABV9VP50_9ACTN